MKKPAILKPVILLLFSIFFTSTVFSQTNTEGEKLKVFIDCPFCDISFIKQEMDYLSYVRDRLLSDVHVQILNRSTGSGGQEYSIFFFGQNDFKNVNDTLVFSSNVDQTNDDIRKMQLKSIQLGLVPYLIKKGFIDNLTLNVSGFGVEGAKDEKDPWKNWVFSINGGSWMNGQESASSLSVNGNLSARKITEDIKIETSLGFYYSQDKYTVLEEVILSESRSQNGDFSVVKSLNDHWSIGGFLDGNSSLYNNYKFNMELAPGIEYNVYPYKESTKHQIRFTYKLGGRYSHYNETTVYNKIEETLAYESLGVSSEFKEKWGSISSSIRGSHYFHDTKINSVNFRLNFNLRLYKGLSWRVGGSFRVIHDQISLPRVGATPEEILLQQRQLQTGYRYWGNMGLTYTFGSIYNNVVNPRFGN